MINLKAICLKLRKPHSEVVHFEVGYAQPPEIRTRTAPHFLIVVRNFQIHRIWTSAHLNSVSFEKNLKSSRNPMHLVCMCVRDAQMAGITFNTVHVARNNTRTI
jgi:hypothetical protein